MLCPSSGFSFPCHRRALLSQPGGEQGTSSTASTASSPEIPAPAAPGDPKPSLQGAAPDPLAVPTPPAPARGQLEAGGGSGSWRSSSRFAEGREGADAFRGAISKHAGAVRENRGVTARVRPDTSRLPCQELPRAASAASLKPCPLPRHSLFLLPLIIPSGSFLQNHSHPTWYFRRVSRRSSKGRSGAAARFHQL